jgi:hypothetical protein
MTTTAVDQAIIAVQQYEAVKAAGLLAEVAIPESWLIAHPTEAGKFLVRHPGGLNLSVAVDGTLGLDVDTGAYQTWVRDGGRIAAVAIGTSGADYPCGCWALPVIAGV